MKLNNSQSTKEMSTMINAFNTMTDELDDLYGNLEQQVADRTERLQKLSEQAIAQREEIKKVNERLQQESAYKSDFLATMSHELKTPLTATISYLEALQSKQFNLSDEEKQLASSAEASSKELLLIEYLLQETLPLARRRNVTIVRKADPACPLIYSDWGKLRHVLLNLMSNAIKFSHEGGIVELAARICEDGKHVQIAVTDHGIGIAREDLDSIFDRFSQTSHWGNANPDGSGLGLYIVKEYAQLLGGEVAVESELGKGTEVYFTLKKETEQKEEHDE